MLYESENWDFNQSADRGIGAIQSNSERCPEIPGERVLPIVELVNVDKVGSLPP